MDTLLDDNYYEIWSKITFTYVTFLELFIISKKINILANKWCKEFGLYGLLLCRSECEYDISENSGNRCIIYKNVYKSNRNNKCKEIGAYNYYKKTCIVHYLPGTNQWTCYKCKENKTRPHIDNMYSVYKTTSSGGPSGKTCPIPTIKESLCTISKKGNICENIIIDNKNLTTYMKTGIHVIDRDYYYWKGPILQGIKYLECCDCYDKSIKRCCSICKNDFYSMYFGSKPQLCNICLSNK